MKRLFAAIKITPTPEFVRVLTQISGDLHHERIKWVETNNIHITLKFFGETDENQIPSIKKALQEAANQSTRFIMKINRTGIFGSRYDPRVVWFGIDPEPCLDQLAANTVKELQKAGWEPDRQNFVPHLTIGRIKELRDKALFQQIINKYKSASIQEQEIKEVILYESILRREGPLYLKLGGFELK
ncbi:MAG: RNA 2',3'-cyclic phosphodiesterase [Bacteroidetes bacterium]|nr:RNA 2',3'-cyclic phosphodiesterase [Bacteroidota bacterium]